MPVAEGNSGDLFACVGYSGVVEQLNGSGVAISGFALGVPLNLRDRHRMAIASLECPDIQPHNHRPIGNRAAYHYEPCCTAQLLLLS